LNGPRPAALLTGATGFVGVELTRELAARGHAVYALARPESDRSQLDGSQVRWRDGELRRPESVEAAVADVCRRHERPWVIHNGAVISYRTRDRALQQAVNVGGTRNLIEACRRHPVGRLLHVSSVVAVGQARAAELLDERAPYNLGPVRCDYADTKRAAEELALGAADALDIVAVNPGAIFGLGARVPNTLKFLKQLAHGPRLPLTPPGSLAVVGVRDVIAGMLAALERGRRGERYLLVESSWSSLELFRLAARLLGVPEPRRAAPRALWRGLELASRGVDLVASPGLLTPQTVRMLGVHFRFDSEKARSELGWSPEPFETVLSGVIAGLRSRGEL
jgi:dihydroflavonol-4-reductase